MAARFRSERRGQRLSLVSLETFTRHLVGEAYEKKNGEEWFRISSSLHFFDPRTGFERAVRLLEPGVAAMSADPRNFAFPTGDKDS